MAEIFEKIRPILTNMEVGVSTNFPIEKLKTVRTQASELGAILSRRYKTKTDRVKKVIIVTRES